MKIEGKKTLAAAIAAGLIIAGAAGCASQYDDKDDDDQDQNTTYHSNGLVGYWIFFHGGYYPASKYNGSGTYPLYKKTGNSYIKTGRATTFRNGTAIRGVGSSPGKAFGKGASGRSGFGGSSARGGSGGG